jgi:hypothetical protein
MGTQTMTSDEVSAIVNDANASLMRRLTDGGKPVDSVVTVVLFKDDGEAHVHMASSTRPESDAEADRLEGSALIEAADLIDTYVHDHNLCVDCNERKGPVQ